MTPDIPTQAAAVLRFWFEDLTPAQWWRTDPQLDAEVRARFGDLHARLAAEVEPGWLATPQTALAAVLVLDQFSRNLYRGDARAFAQDAAARRVADAAIAGGFDQAFEAKRRAFFYLPFMHAEDPEAQVRCVELYEAMGDENHVRHAREHKAVIDRFGRFPKRNAAMGRASTDEERDYIAGSNGAV